MIVEQLRRQIFFVRRYKLRKQEWTPLPTKLVKYDGKMQAYRNKGVSRAPGGIVLRKALKRKDFSQCDVYILSHIITLGIVFISSKARERTSHNKV